eukprot:gene42645-52109_t
MDVLLRHSVRLGRAPNVTVSFVGDSLTAQLSIAALCAFETLGISNITEVTFRSDATLRPDFPCKASCANAEVRKTKAYLCSGCNNTLLANGKVESKLYSLKDEHHWLHVLPVNVTVLVLGTGAWYSRVKETIEDDDLHYQAT